MCAISSEKIYSDIHFYNLKPQTAEIRSSSYRVTAGCVQWAEWIYYKNVYRRSLALPFFRLSSSISTRNIFTLCATYPSHYLNTWSRLK